MGEAGCYVAVSVQGDSIAGHRGPDAAAGAGTRRSGASTSTVDDVDATAAKVGPAGGKVEAGRST